MLAFCGGNSLHLIGAAVRAQKLSVTAADRFSTFVASTGLHCTSAFADAENVTVRAGVPMSTMSWDQMVSFVQASG